MAPRREPALHLVVIVGAGPVGLTLAIDLAQHGVRVVLLDAAGALPAESRAICYAQRTLDVWDRLGCGEPIAAHGVAWNTAALVAMHDGLTAEQSRLANSALILLLANHVGDTEVLEQALVHARAVGLDVAPEV